MTRPAGLTSIPSLFCPEESRFSARNPQIITLKRVHHPPPLLDLLVPVAPSPMMPPAFLVLRQDSGAMRANSAQTVLTSAPLDTLHRIPAGLQTKPGGRLKTPPEVDRGRCMLERRPEVGDQPRLVQATRAGRYARPCLSDLRRVLLCLQLPR